MREQSVTHGRGAVALPGLISSSEVNEKREQSLKQEAKKRLATRSLHRRHTL